jgi:hypothetical protein
MRHTVPALVLVAAGVLFEASPVGAQPIYRPYYPPAPTATPLVRVSPNVYVYPQGLTMPNYSVPQYGYSSGLSGGYTTNTGSFSYWYSPFGGNYYYTNPGYPYWFQLR